MKSENNIDKKMIANNLSPFEPTHPGELIKEEIEFRELSQSTLAKQMGMSYKVLNDIVNQRRPITTTTALLFEAALSISADLLIQVQIKYNIYLANQDKTFAQRLAEIRKAVSAAAI